MNCVRDSFLILWKDIVHPSRVILDTLSGIGVPQFVGVGLSSAFLASTYIIITYKSDHSVSRLIPPFAHKNSFNAIF